MPALPKKRTLAGLSLAAALVAPTAPLLADDYYAGESQFHMWPDPGAARYKSKRNNSTIPAGSGRNSNIPFGVVLKNEIRPHFADGKIIYDLRSLTSICGSISFSRIIKRSFNPSTIP